MCEREGGFLDLYMTATETMIRSNGAAAPHQPESDSALFHRSIDFHQARKHYNGFGNESSSDFKLVTLNPTSGPLKPSGLEKITEKSSELSEAGLDPALSFEITFRRIVSFLTMCLKYLYSLFKISGCLYCVMCFIMIFKILEEFSRDRNLIAVVHVSRNWKVHNLAPIGERKLYMSPICYVCPEFIFLVLQGILCMLVSASGFFLLRMHFIFTSLLKV